ncbi:MAG: hypothetical protein Q8Q29_06320 [Actinomycetota bacterium]|jgi:hypothetical protein|nr:hypothetical protein [Actinomycetota bacterium]
MCPAKQDDEDAMNVMRWNGQPVPVDGWWIDPHGHRLFLRAGDLTPICPRSGPATVAWTLVRGVTRLRRPPG